MSKIISLRADNFKRLRAVDITPEPHLNVIAGRNAQGKTSVLDAITAALGGVSAKTTPRPIRDGETRAEIVLETEDLIVTRTFTASGSTVTVKGRDGVKRAKAQSLLDGLLGRLSLDPLGFTQLSDRDQRATLLELADLPFDPAELDAERAEAYEIRTEVNRELKALHAQTFDLPPNPPTEEVSVGTLIAEYRAVEDARRILVTAGDAMHAARAEVDRIDDEIERLQQQRAAALETCERAETEYAERSKTPLPDLAEIQQKIDTVEQTNRQARDYMAWQVTQQAIAERDAEAADLTKKIAGIDQRKADGLKAAKLPVEGLGFDAEGITYNGVPFKQASGAEQLRVSLAMAIALNPGLRVIRIADGSLLDSESLALVERMAVEHDYQVWIEMVSDAEDFGIIIEDGQVVDPNFF